MRRIQRSCILRALIALSALGTLIVLPVACKKREAIPEPVQSQPTPRRLEYDLIQHAPPSFIFEGVDVIETSQDSRWRWANGPSSSISFPLARAGKIDFDFASTTLTELQEMTIEINGVPADQKFRGRGPFTATVSGYGIPGQNKITFRFKTWNGAGGEALAPGEPRPLAMSFNKMKVIQP